MQALAIFASCIAAAIVYGVLHNQITARLCVEYFTVAHPPIFATDSPTLLGIGWGVIATWWVGLLLGAALAIAALAGSRPRRTVRTLLRPVALLLLAMASMAGLAGIAGWFIAESGMIDVTQFFPLPAEKNSAFVAAACAHNMSYAAGFVGGIIVFVRVWKSRTA